MAKATSQFVCNNCGAKYPKWMGKCLECGSWNTIEETLALPETKKSVRFSGFAGAQSEVCDLSNVSMQELPRMHMGFRELDRVLGGGIVPGSVVLIGGNPGAGKSTLLLQMLSYLAQNQVSVLYITGEESLQQVALRAKRLELQTKNVKIATETSIDKIIALAQVQKPQIMVIDSIQVMHVEGISSAPGSVSQVREGAAILTQFAKANNIATIIVGHVTKDGTLAGPKILEHCVDCSVLLEGDGDSRFRTLRCQKNRFGAVNEIGVFAMIDKGMREITNPSAIFLNRTEIEIPGSVVMVLWVGSRPLLVELQVLVDLSQYGNPRRLTIGTDQNRLAMILAVLHRHASLALGDQDVFVNVVGGVKVEETSADLPLAAALYSSYAGKVIPRDMIIFGEVGLSGEIRPVNSGSERVIEAQKHGFTKAIIPKENMPRKPIQGMTIYPVTKVSEILDLL
ncbi:MAG: DNA repair protein RadA [Succinivibrionaceae bacterium]|nr:DNA repair protein RadA [Succinivibrionaceae bacterium]MEE1339951.1 DNA repair protein RadA [Succinivibrionaceae bacterium]